jgi:hypothetical protein
MTVSGSLVQVNGWQRSFQASMKRPMAERVGHGGKVAAAQGLPGDDREERLDQVQPGARGRGEVQGDPGWRSSQARTAGCLWVDRLSTTTCSCRRG